ncbi:MAG: FkbM family methyltransferase [Silicimonas sp.]|nr:FkbM family methyltransferase [Silicimonas sp.]
MGAISRYIARRYLVHASRENIEQFPQLACYSFDLITNIIVLDGQYERDQLEFLAKKVFPALDASATCLDVGGNIGNHSVFFANHFKKVITLEPHPRNFALLSVNADLAPNVLPLPIGASNAASTVRIVEDKMNLAASSMHRSEGRAGNVVEFEVVKIDDMREVQDAGVIAFMKLDIEGHEAAALEGAEDTIARHKPVIMLEVLKDEISGGSSQSLNVLRSMGYAHFYEPVEAGWLGTIPRRLKKLVRAVNEIVLGRRVSKAERLVKIDTLEDRNYLMILCCADEPEFL